MNAATHPSARMIIKVAAFAKICRLNSTVLCNASAATHMITLNAMPRDQGLRRTLSARSAANKLKIPAAPTSEKPITPVSAANCK